MTGTTDQLYDNLEAGYQHSQRLPRAADLARFPSKVSARTHQLRFGSWSAAM
ncbi:MAG TPA: hypothetical protein VFP34_01580 [Microlunatus sp.]|nr:hypothetical protein [Microlunatus sp.]